jgi:Interferon-induced transmembrane protein
MAYDDEDDLDISIRRGGRGGIDANIPNYLVQAILVTVCCPCWPLGIFAIVQAAKVNGLIAQGDYEAARRASESAKMWCIITLVVGVLVGFGWIALQFMAEHNRF